jgi:hypothetical protein
LQAQEKNDKRPAERRKTSYTALPLWWGGLCFVIFGSLGDFVALTFAPQVRYSFLIITIADKCADSQSVVMPVGALTLSANLYFANVFFGETLTLIDKKGTMLVIIGAVGIALSYGAMGEVPDKEYTVEDLMSLYRRWVMLGYGIGVALILGFFYTMKVKGELIISDKNRGADSGQMEQMVLGLPIGRWYPISYAACSGVWGAQSVRGSLLRSRWAQSSPSACIYTMHRCSSPRRRCSFSKYPSLRRINFGLMISNGCLSPTLFSAPCLCVFLFRYATDARHYLSVFHCVRHPTPPLTFIFSLLVRLATPPRRQDAFLGKGAGSFRRTFHHPRLPVLLHHFFDRRRGYLFQRAREF